MRRVSKAALLALISFFAALFVVAQLAAPSGAYAAPLGSAAFRGDAMLIGSNMPAPGLNDFTYELYFKMNSLPSLAGVNTVGGGIWLFTTRPNRWNPGGVTVFINTNGSLQLDASDSAAKNITSITSASGTVAINNWYHLAVTRSANTFKIWVNGLQVSTGSALSTASGKTGNYNSTLLGLGEYLPGNITNFRFTNGTALYTTAFTPSSNQLTADGVSQVLIPLESDYTTISSYSTVPTLAQPTGAASGNAYFGGSGFQDATGNLNAGSYLTNNGITFSALNPFPKSDQIITFNSPGTKIFGSGTVALVATSNSALAVAFTSATTNTCTISGSTLTLVASGDCIVNANQAGDESYNAASQVQQTFAISKADQAITFSTITDKALSAGTLSISASGGASGNAVTFTSATASKCTVAATTVTFVAVGTCTITANQLGTANYNAASQVQQSFIILKSTSRTITFPTTSFSLNYGTTQTVSAIVSARANIPTITFNGNANTNTNPRLTIGINGNQGANGNFFGYSGNQGSFTEGQIVTMSDLRSGSTVTYSGKLHFVLAGGFGWAFYLTDILSATGSSINTTSTNWLLTGEGAITYSAGASTACSVDRWTGQVSITSGSGTCEISSTVVEDSEYQAMTTTVPVSITVNKIAQSTLSLTLSASSKSAPYSQALTLTPSGGTGSGVTTYAIVAGGTASGCSLANTSSSNTISATSAGTCLLQAIKAADSNYNSATSSTQTFTFNSSNQVTALVITSTNGTYGTDLNLTTSGGSGSGAVSFATSTAGCSLPTSNTLRVIGPVTCQVTATKAADVDYNAASSVLTNVIFASKQLTITGLSGINKVFDGSVASSVSGSPTLSGIVDGDVVTLLGAPTFTFTNSSVANSKLVSASGYTLTGIDSLKYTLLQPTVNANITKKGATVTAANATVVVGDPYTPAFSVSGLVGSDSITAITYSFSSTGTGTPPTTISSSVITPSAAIFGVIGAGDNYNLSYVTGTLNIVSSFQVLFKSNFTSSDTSTVTVNFVPGDTPINQAAPNRNNFTFLGWFTSAIGGTKVNGEITPLADSTYWAHWIQNSLNGMGAATKIGTFTTDIQYLDTFTRSGDYGTVTVSIPAGALPHQTLVDIYQVTDPARANSLLAGSNYVLSLVVAWLAPDATVPTTQVGKPVTMTISNATIKKGAKIYAIVNDEVTLLGIAAQDGSAQVLITDDPEVVVVTTKPDAPTGIAATSGENASSTVSWLAPSDGGSVITAYTATSNAGHSCTSTTTSCVVTGLANGTSYTFTVTARNSIGTSDASSASTAVTPVAPAISGGGNINVPPTPDPSIALAKAIAEKAEADAKAAAELKAAQDRAAAQAAAEAALKAAQELADAQAKAAAELKAAQEKAAAEAAAEAALKAALEKAEADLRAAAEKKAAEDAAAAARLAAKKIVPKITLYSISSSLKLSAYDNAYLKKYVSTLKPNAKVTCVGYIYTKNLTYVKAKALASKQAKAVCALIKSQKKTIITSTVLYPASKAPKAAAGAKWVAVSYRVDGYKN